VADPKFEHQQALKEIQKNQNSIIYSVWQDYGFVLFVLIFANGKINP
jgi:hypothetical protein